MLDLPLSELQASIESEFEGGDCEHCQLSIGSP